MEAPLVDVVEAEAHLPQVLELSGIGKEQVVPLAGVVDGEQDAAVAGELVDHLVRFRPAVPMLRSPEMRSTALRRRSIRAFM